MRKKRFLNTMMALLVSISFSCLSTNVYAQNNVAKKDTTTKIVNKFNWEPVILAIAQVESHENPKAVSKSGTYVGYLQISPILVKECNNIVGYQKYTLNDRYSVEKSKEMFVLIQKKYNPTCNVEKAIRIWNGGCGYTIKGTQTYYTKVMGKYSQIAKY